jgi:DNA-binding CsgD family transcriptional regulator
MKELEPIAVNNIFLAKKILFDTSLNEIQGIKFTLREVDVLACLLHNRGEKKIAQLLGISPRTVETHINNIKLKLSGCTREYIIDFIEDSDKINLFRQFYGYLSIKRHFEGILSNIKNSIKTTIYYDLHCPQENSEDNALTILQELQKNLEFVNIKQITKKDDSKVDVTIYVTKKAPEDNKPNYIYITFDQDSDSRNNVINFSSKENFYTSLLRLISAISGETILASSVIEAFENKYQVFYNSWINGKKNTNSVAISNNLKNTIKAKSVLIWGILAIIILISIAAIIRSKSNSPKNPPIKLEVPLLSNNVYLERPLIIKRIDQILQGAKDIGIVALVGIGGAGKTTLAQQYAYSKTNTSLVWEINATSQENIINSFEHLAYSFCQTAEEKKDFSKIQEIPNHIKREKMLYSFLTSKAKKYPNWIVIYDNVENIKDIQRYLPRHQENWGKGSVIITTTNSNISHNNIIDNNNIINIPEL